ncbi:MAG: glycosyltransferase family 2 protein [Candidatus Aenigmarchaeota archaeon]|nr:glycosyltransferase family 2 protein [Candidatus Aenigmarchaeota archaeon]
MHLSIVVSLYNEEQVARQFIEELVGAIEGHEEVEIVLVNNGSTDRTGKILDSYSQERGVVKVVHNPVPTMGKGNGIAAGIKNASGKYIALMDGDMQQDPKDVFNLLGLMERKNLDYIIGWRRRRQDSMDRLALSFAYNVMIKTLFNIPVWDIGGQPRIFKADYLKRVDITCKRWLIELEVPYKMKKMGLRGGFGRVSHRPREKGASKINMVQAWSIFKDLMLFRLGA